MDLSEFRSRPPIFEVLAVQEEGNPAIVLAEIDYLTGAGNRFDD